MWVGVAGHGPPGWSVRVDLAGRDGRPRDVRFEHPTDSLANWLLFEGRRAVVEMDVPDVAPWSAEVPNLHRLDVTLVDDDGIEVDAVVARRRVPAGRGASATSCSSTAAPCSSRA